MSPLSKEASHKILTFTGQLVSEKMFENNGHIHVYGPGAGVDKPMRSINFLSIWSFVASFFH